MPRPSKDRSVNPSHQVVLAHLQNFARIPTGWAPVDLFSGGGIPAGTNSLFSGVEGAGKTTIVTCTIANYLSLFPEQKVLYCIADNKIENYADRVAARGGDASRIEVLRPENAEECQFVVAETADKRMDVGIIVVDSLASLSPEGEIIGHDEISIAARLNNKFLRKMTSIQLGRITKKQPVTLLVINQNRMKVGLFPTTVLPGGNQQRFQAALWLSFSKPDLHIDKASGLPIAQTFRFVFNKNEGGAAGYPGEIRMATTPHGKWLPGDLIDHEFIWKWAVQYFGLLKNNGTKGYSHNGGEPHSKAEWIMLWEDDKKAYAKIKKETGEAFLNWLKGKKQATFIKEENLVTIAAEYPPAGE